MDENVYFILSIAYTPKWPLFGTALRRYVFLGHFINYMLSLMLLLVPFSSRDEHAAHAMINNHLLTNVQSAIHLSCWVIVARKKLDIVA